MEINPVEKAMEISSVSETNNEIPYEEAPQINLNKKEALFIRKYIRHRGDCLVNVKKRSIIPFYIIDSVFTIYNIPVELKYLAVIESELKANGTKSCRRPGAMAADARDGPYPGVENKPYDG